MLRGCGMADRLTLARALEKGGIKREAAEDIATQVFDAIHENTVESGTARSRVSCRIIFPEGSVVIQCIRENQRYGHDEERDDDRPA
jgi:hypothetical protein